MARAVLISTQPELRSGADYLNRARNVFLRAAGVPNTYFCNEGIDSYVAAPIGTGTSASCLSGEQPIYRAFRGATDDGNHRYLVNSSMYSYMV